MGVQEIPFVSSLHYEKRTVVAGRISTVVRPIHLQKNCRFVTMKNNLPALLIHYFIAAVWLINGLFCKVLNLVPRHQKIVERILHIENGRLLTLLIGISEIAMATWIISGYHKRVNAIVQIFIILIMNILEFFLAPDLLLWGQWNALFAFLLVLLIFFNNFRKTPQKR